MDKIALIPAYEPDEKLITLVQELKNNKYNTVVIDDGSGKKYRKIFDECKKYAKVISYETNKGKGHALKTGFSYIKDNYKKYVVITLDSDGQHTVKDANNLYEYSKKNEEYLILGKRIRNKSVPLRSKLGNSITRLVFNLVSKADIYDTQTGLRAFSYKLMDYMLAQNGERFEYEMNMLLNANNNNIKIKEVEIETIYINENKGSHFNTIKDSYKIYKEIIKFSMSSITSFVVDYLLFSLFVLLLENIIISNIFARIISATVNYNLNKKLVFKSKNKSSVKYFFLAGIILILNTFILTVFKKLNINIFVAKILTEIILFTLSFIVQKIYIFRSDKNEKI